MTFDVNIISTGSKGNCVVIDDKIVLDAGLSKKKVTESGYDLDNMEFLFVSHKHADHKNLAFIKFAIEKKREVEYNGKFEKVPQVAVHIPRAVYDELRDHYKTFEPDDHDNIFVHYDTEEVQLTTTDGQDYILRKHAQKHYDIINYAIVIEHDGERMLYVTDLDTVEPTDVGPGLTSLGMFDTIVMEGNYDEIWLRDYINIAGAALDDELDLSSYNDEELDKYVRENYRHIPKEISAGLFRAVQNMRHLSKQQARAFVRNHLNKGGVYYEVHRSSMFYERPEGWTLG